MSELPEAEGLNELAESFDSGPLAEALARNEEVFEPTWEESLLFAEAAKRWLDLESRVAEGA